MVQANVIETFNFILQGGATYDEMVDEWGLARESARRRVHDLKREDELPDIHQDARGVWRVGLPSDSDSRLALRHGQESQTEPPKSVRYPLSPAEQGSRTKAAKETTRKMLEWCNTMRQEMDTPKLPKDSMTAGNEEYDEDIVLLRGDDHIGQLAEVPDGEGEMIRVYDTPTAIAAIREVTSQVPEIIERFSINPGALHYCLNGDTVTNVATYRNQCYDTDLGLYEQIFLAVKTHLEEIDRLRQVIPEVHVHFQHGNHGRIDHGEPAFNADRVVYNVMYLMMGAYGWEDVYVQPPDEAGYTNFNARNWKYHMRHGDKYLTHVGTSSGQNRVRADVIHHGERDPVDSKPIDVVLRSNYHVFKIEETSGVKVIMNPALSACGDFEDDIGAFTESAGLVFGVSDDERVSWTKEITIAGGLPVADPRADGVPDVSAQET